MTIEDILYGIRTVKESDMLPLSKVKTAEDKKKYEQEGYIVPYTYGEWKERFPGIDADYIFMFNGINFSVVYHDKENLTYLHLLPLVMARGEKEISAMAEKVKMLIKHCKEHLQGKTYFQLLFSYPDALRVEGLEQLLQIEGPTEAFYKVFVEIYTASDFFTRNLSPKIVDALRKAKSEVQQKETERRLQKYFGDTKDIIVYRGMSEHSTPAEKALSWTPNINVAYRFAVAYSQEPQVIQGIIKREDILEYISPDTTMGNEEEIIVEPGKVNIQERNLLLPPDSDEMCVLTDEVLPVYQTYRQKLKKLYQKHANGLSGHDAEHSLRVLLLALLLAAKYNVSKAEMKQIAEAAIYHDIGRVDEAANTSHGKLSEIIYEKDGGKDKAVAFLIRNHCVDDETAHNELIGLFSFKTQKRIEVLYGILKDADALDRVRFGFAINPMSDGLDVRYLRNAFAKKLVFFAAKAKGALKL